MTRFGAGILMVSATALGVACGKSASSSSDAGGTAGMPRGGASTAGATNGGASGNAAHSVGGTSGVAGVVGSGAGTAGSATTVGGSAGHAGTSSMAGSSGTASSTGGTSGSGGESGEGGGGAGGEGGAAPVMENPAGGQITLSFIKYDDGKFNDGNHSTQTSAAFWRASLPSAAPHPCEVRAYGACTVQTCPSTAPDPAPPPAVAAPSAGTVSLTASAVSYAKTLTPDAGYGAYGSDVDTLVKFLGGESVSVSASGGEIPAFSTTMEMPVPLTLTTELPERDDAANIPFELDHDLTLSFAGGMPGLVIQVDGLTGISGGATESTLHCFLASESGTVTIPSAALAELGSYAFVHLWTLRRSTVVAGDYKVLLVFGMDVIAADGLPARLVGAR